MALNVDSLSKDPQEFQAYLDELNDDQLTKLEVLLVATFTKVREEGKDNPSGETTAKATVLSDQVKATRSAIKDRKALAVTKAAEATAEAHRAALEDLDVLVLGKKEDDSKAEVATVSPGVDQLVASLASAFDRAVSQRIEVVTAGGSNPTPNLNQGIRNMSLGKIGANAPDPRVAPARSEAVIVASSDIPGVAKSGTIAGIDDLVRLMGARARMLSVTKGNPNYVPVASLQRDHRYRLSLDSTPEEINEVLTAATDINALVAAGGWCSPSEISYDFFNVVCEDGMLDLPSVGVLNRGGFRFPTSPTIASVFADSPEAIWSWTEQQDIDAITSDSDVKTCARVPCPEFEEVRAACDGLCVTAGNLVDFSYPELVANFIRLVMAARAHATNQNVIAQLVAASTAVNIDTIEGAASGILNALELQAFDYRERYRMCEGSVLEAVFPRWVFGVIRADLSNRTGINLLNVTNAMIADWFDLRGIRAQFVADWQSGFTGSPIGAPTVNATAWPTTVQFLLYAPGTFVRGQGLQLDLGVVRDSVLNETNDHTAAWMEDCFAVAMVGHESRIVTVDLCTAGVTGAAELSCAPEGG